MARGKAKRAAIEASIAASERQREALRRERLATERAEARRPHLASIPTQARRVADMIASGATVGDVVLAEGGDAFLAFRERDRRRHAIASGRMVTSGDSMPEGLPDDGSTPAPEWYRTLTFAGVKVPTPHPTSEGPATLLADGWVIGCATEAGGRGWTVKVETGPDGPAGEVRTRVAMVNPSAIGIDRFDPAFRAACDRIGVEPRDGARPTVAAVIGRDRTYDASRNRVAESQVWAQIPAGIYDSHDPTPSPALERDRERANRRWSAKPGRHGIGAPKRSVTVEVKRKAPPKD